MAFEASWLQRQLGRELLELREARGLTTREVGEALGWAHTKIGRIERAENKIDPMDVIRIARLYRLPDSESERLCAMARESRSDIWWEKYKSWINESYYAHIGYENDATRLMTIQTYVVPGLFQTRDYIAGLFETSALVRDVDRVEAHTEVRLLRQRRLFEPEPLIVDAMIEENVLDTPYGGTKVLNAQLRHLRELSQLPSITVRIIASATTVNRMPLDIYEFGGADGPAVVMSETLFETIIHDNPVQVRRARRAFEHVQASALSPGESEKLIEQRIRETD